MSKGPSYGFFGERRMDHGPMTVTTATCPHRGSLARLVFACKLPPGASTCAGRCRYTCRHQLPFPKAHILNSSTAMHAVWRMAVCRSAAGGDEHCGKGRLMGVSGDVPA